MARVEHREKRPATVTKKVRVDGLLEQSSRIAYQNRNRVRIGIVKRRLEMTEMQTSSHTRWNPTKTVS